MKIIFATDDDPLSVAIRTATACPWHHVGAVFGDYVVEARFEGVLYTHIDEVKARGDYAIVDYPLRDEKSAERFALAQVGKEYDFIGLIGFQFRIGAQDPNKWYCSELIQAISAVGRSPIVRENLKGVSPRDLWVSTK